MKFSLILILPLLLTGASNVTDDEVLARAQCQCSVDGLSAGVDVFWWARRSKTYPSENVRDGGPYQFIGCGAHTLYRDRSEDQIGGYPWRFCYTYGGKAGCTITETSQKYSLNSKVAYRFCNGDYDCKASANVQVQGGTLIGTEVIDLYSDEEGTLQDWTDCCQVCGQTNDCTAWDFSVETMKCRLFSTFESTLTVEGDAENPPLWYAGTSGGYDDKPLVCWFRNQYETCSANFNSLLVASIILGVAGLLFLVCWYMGRLSHGKDLCWTDDVTPRYARRVVRSRPSKHGGSKSYTVISYTADLVYKYQGQVHRRAVQIVNRPMQLNVKLYFLVASGGALGSVLIVLGPSLPKCDGCFVFLYAILLSGLMCLFVLSLQIAVTDGGLFQAKYALQPASGDRGVWIAICALTLLTILATTLITIISYAARGKRCKPENTYTREE